MFRRPSEEVRISPQGPAIPWIHPTMTVLGYFGKSSLWHNIFGNDLKTCNGSFLTDPSKRSHAYQYCISGEYWATPDLQKPSKALWFIRFSIQNEWEIPRKRSERRSRGVWFRVIEEQKSREIWKTSAQIENPFNPDHFHDKNHANLILEHRGMKSHESARSHRETTRIYGFLASRDFADLYQVIPGSCRIKFAWKSI